MSSLMDGLAVAVRATMGTCNDEQETSETSWIFFLQTVRNHETKPQQCFNLFMITESARLFDKHS